MSRVEEAIGDALGLTKSIKQEILDPKPYTQTMPARRPDETGDIDTDYRYSRENFYNLIETGSDAIDGILEVAKESDHPRAFEVAGQLIKTVSEVTERLADLQEKMKKLKEVPDHGPRSVTNALFVGSTHELQKMIKANASDIDKL